MVIFQQWQHMQPWMMNATSSLWCPMWSFEVSPFLLQARAYTARYIWQGWRKASFRPWVELPHPALPWLLTCLLPPSRMLCSYVRSKWALCLFPSPMYCPIFLESTSCLFSSSVLKSLEANLCLLSWNLWLLIDFWQRGKSCADLTYHY